MATLGNFRTKTKETTHQQPTPD